MNVVSNSPAECFSKVQEFCAAVGATAIEVAPRHKNSLGLVVSSNGHDWALDVSCDWPPHNSLPAVHLIGNDRLLAHVSCTGWVCVNDSESLSIDFSRHADTVAETVIAALKLLEHSQHDSEHGYVEFFNELEGYWSNRPEMAAVGRTVVEVDEHSRAITSYLEKDDGTSPVYFLEQSAEKPVEFPTNEAQVYRSAYFCLPEVVLPPAPGQPLNTDYLTDLFSEFDSGQESLLTNLLGNSPQSEKVTLLVSMPRAAGGRSLIGFRFSVIDGRLDQEAPVANLLMVRHTASYMRERGGANLDLGNRHIVIFGCGSVGSEVADALATSGIGRLTLVDPQQLTSDNVFRHVLGRYWIGTSKARGLEGMLTMNYPGIDVESFADGAYRWLLANTRTDIDGFIIALGMPTLERQVARAIRQGYPKIPIVHTWLEPLDLGGHAVLVNSSGQGCLDCLYRDDEGVDSLAPRTSYLAPGQTLTRNLTGCASTFTPYGAIQSRRTALLAAEQMLKALHGIEAPRYAYWAGDGTAAAANGLQVTAWWNKAKSNSALDMTGAMFGSPCKHCRASK